MNSATPKTITLKVPGSLLMSILGVVVLLIVAFIFVPNPTQWRPVLVFAAAVMAGGAGLTTAINNVNQRAASADSSAKAAQEARVAAALDFFYRWIHPHFFHCKKNGREILKFFKDNASTQTQIEYLDADASRWANLIDVLNTFEALSIAIDLKAVDDETARRFFRSIVLDYWHLSEGVLKKKRAEQNNARLYKEFEDLYQQWKN